MADFGQAMEAYNRLLDLKDKYVDEEVLSVLVRGLKCLVEEKSESGTVLPNRLLIFLKKFYSV